MSERKKLTRSFAAKIIFTVIYFISVAVGGLGAVGAAVMWETGVYSHSGDYYVSGVIDNMMRNDANQVVFDTLVIMGRNPELTDAQAAEMSGYSPSQTNFYCDIYDSNGNLLFQTNSAERACGYNAQFRVSVPATFFDENGFSYSNDFDGQNNTGANVRILTVKCYINRDMTVHDRYYYAENILTIAYSMRYSIYAVAGAAVVLMLISYIFLMCATGHGSDGDEIKLNAIDKIPFDLLLLIASMLCCTAVIGESISSNLLICIFAAAYAMVASMLFLGVSCTFAARFKAGGWWKNTLIYRCLKLVWRIMRAIGRIILRGFRYIGKLLKAVFLNISLTWQVVCGYVALALVDLIVYVIAYNSPGLFLLLFIIGRIIIGVFLAVIIIWMRRLEDGARRLRRGETSYKIDTEYMYGPFLAHAEDLNGISDGLNIAVGERMKSERLKTELITNVSHDIKTPLTSIINYVDLIKKENVESEPLKGYIDVLERQSARLKKLICDLVEASKASTGNITVELETLDLGVSLSQAAGEYEERLTGAGLTLVTRAAAENIRIKADGKLLWRVYDNLFGNIVKYALAGTRVYIDTGLSEDGGATVSFKNISKEQLNISPDELTERFVRGDSSRHTEGSGLGLAIAKSLCELMGGTLKLSCDGDLFKVELTFAVAAPIDTAQ